MPVSVSPSHTARFQLVRFDPRRPWMRGNGIRFRTVKELVEACPLLVRAGKSYIHPTQPHTRFSAGDAIRLLRVLRRCGIKYLECRVQRLSNILRLPMDCSGDFEIINDSRYYTLQELIYALPRKRCLRLAPDIINERYRLPGLPPRFTGEIFLERPNFLVLANPVESPGQIMMIPEKVDITVSPREDTYIGHLEHEYLLEAFAVDNESMFPLEARVTNWDEQSALMQAFSVSPGSVLTMHELKDVPKYLLQSGDQHLVVPEEYRQNFIKAPRTFSSVAELENLGRIMIKVVEGADSPRADLHGTVTDTILKILTETPQIIVLKKDGKAEEEIEVLQMTRVGVSDRLVMNVPLYLGGTYEEVLQGRA